MSAYFVTAAGTLGGLSALGLFSPDPVSAAALVTVTMLAALLPDVDTDSKGQHLFYGLLLAVDAGLIFFKHYKWSAILGLVAMLPAVGRHRGWTHTWWAMLAVPGVLAAVPAVVLDLSPEAVGPYFAAAVLGYGSHLVLDGIW